MPSIRYESTDAECLPYNPYMIYEHTSNSNGHASSRRHATFDSSDRNPYNSYLNGYHSPCLDLDGDDIDESTKEILLNYQVNKIISV